MILQRIRIIVSRSEWREPGADPKKARFRNAAFFVPGFPLPLPIPSLLKTCSSISSDALHMCQQVSKQPRVGGVRGWGVGGGGGGRGEGGT